MGKLTTVIDNVLTLYIKVSRNDGSGNGYTTGHPILYRFWDQSASAETSNTTAVYLSTNPSWNTTGTFTPNATSYVDLSGISTSSLTINLKLGWNIFSSNTLPSNPDMKAVFQSLITGGQLIKIQDENGNALEDLGPFLGGWVNKIGNLALTEGYKIKVKTACQYTFTGIPATRPFPITLKPGWNIIGFPHNVEVNGMAVVQQLIDRKTLLKVQDEMGQAIEDLGPFLGGWNNKIGNFIPGKGYKVKVNTSEVLTIYDSYTKSLAVPPAFEPVVHFRTVIQGNGVDHMNIYLCALSEGKLKAGDEIAVFDGNLCVGAFRITPSTLSENYVSIPVSAEDGLGSPGFTEGHTITFKVWNSATKNEYSVEPLIFKGLPVFLKHESTFASLTKEGLSALEGNLLPGELKAKCYPNPFNEGITIEANLGSSEKVSIDVINQTGQLVRQLLTPTSLDSGIHYFIWDGKNGEGHPVTTGIYYLMVKGGDKPLSFKVVRSE
jgi:hypothetical protein